MIHTEKAYRKNEASPAGTTQLEERLNALDNFGGSSATVEIREELAAIQALPPVIPATPPVAPVERPIEQINGTLGEGGETPQPVETPPMVVKQTPPVEAVPPTEANTAPPVETPIEGGVTTPQPLEIKSDMFENGSFSLGESNKPDAVYSEEIKKFATELGFENPGELTSKLTSYSQGAVDSEALKKEIDGYKKTFEDLPVELHNSMTSFFSGEENWRSHVNSKGIDFTKNIGSIDDKELVESYYPNQFSSEDWDEFKADDGDVNVKRAIQMALDTSKGSFATKQNEINTYQTGVASKRAESVEMINNSVSQTISNLSNQMKGLDPAYVKSIESKILNNEIIATFYNRDGTLKADAAHRFILAQDGSSLIEQYANLHKVQAVNKATQEILERTADTPDLTQGGSSTVSGDNRSAVQQNIDYLEGRFENEKVF